MTIETTVAVITVVFQFASICITICGGVRIVGHVWGNKPKRKRRR
jgi:uncharacterized membrane protein